MNRKVNILQYNLVTTEDGFIPIDEVVPGMKLKCRGEWKEVTEKPVKGLCKKWKAETLPTCIFPYDRDSGIAFLDHNMEIPETEDKDRYEFQLRGYLNERNDTDAMQFNSFVEAMKWFPMAIRFFDSAAQIIPFGHRGCLINVNRKKFEELHGEELKLRNLEYYLEGFMKTGFTWKSWKLLINRRLNETDRLVMRLLDIDLYKYPYNIKSSLKITFVDHYNFCKHLKSDEIKGKMREGFTEHWIINRLVRVPYEDSVKMEVEDCEGWYIPGMYPDMNCMSASEGGLL